VPESCVRALFRGEKPSLLASISSSFFLDSCADHPELLRFVKMKEDCWKALSNYSWAVQWQMRNIGVV